LGGSTVNPSEQVVRAVALESLPDVELRTAVLPADRASGLATLLRAIILTMVKESIEKQNTDAVNGSRDHA
jgi:hypothetical protein